MKLYVNSERNAPPQHHYMHEEQPQLPNSFEIFRHQNTEMKQGTKKFTEELPQYIKNQEQPIPYYKDNHISVDGKTPQNNSQLSNRSSRKSTTPRKKIFQHDSLRIKLKDALSGCFKNNKNQGDEKSGNRDNQDMSATYPQNPDMMAREAVTQSMRPDVRSKIFNNNDNPQYHSGYQFQNNNPSTNNDANLLRQAMAQSIKPEIRSQLLPNTNANNDANLLRQTMSQSTKPEVRSRLFSNKNQPSSQMSDAMLLQQAMVESVKPEMRDKLFNSGNQPSQYQRDGAFQNNDAMLLQQAMAESAQPQMRSKLFNDNTNKYFPQYRSDDLLHMIGSNISNIPFRPDNSERPNLSFGSRRDPQNNPKFMRNLDKQRTDDILSHLILAEDRQKYDPPHPSDVTANLNVKNKDEKEHNIPQQNEYLKLIPEILAKMNKNQAEIRDLRSMMEKLVLEEKNRDQMIHNYIAIGKTNHSVSNEYQPRFANEQPPPRNPHPDYRYQQPQTPKLKQQLSTKSALEKQQMRRLQHLIQQNKHLCRKVMEQRLRNSSSQFMDLSKSYEDRSRTQQHHFPHDEHLNNLDISVIPPVQDSTIYINRKPSAPVVTVNPPKIIVTAFSKANQLNPVPITPQHRKVTFHEKRATQIPRTKIY